MTNRLIAATGCLPLLLTAGCAGRATLHIVPLGSKALDRASPLLTTIRAEECYYWLDDAGYVNVAIRAKRTSLLGPYFHREFNLSLRLPGAPAGSTKQYRLDQNQLRARYDAGLTHERTASYVGNALVWDYGRRVLRGRLRVSGKRQSYSVLTGWGSDTGVLILGEFSAVPNRRKGEVITAHSDASGLDRRQSDEMKKNHTDKPDGESTDQKDPTPEGPS